MRHLFHEAKGDTILYFLQTETEVVELSRQQYIDERKKEADEMYEQVVQLAQQNGAVWAGWLHKHFKMDWYGATYTIDRMREEGLCGAYDRELGASPMIIQSDSYAEVRCAEVSEIDNL